jgi:hypothetical protein
LSCITPTDGTAIAIALQKLGLKLVPAKGPGEFLIIDHAEKRSERRIGGSDYRLGEQIPACFHFGCDRHNGLSPAVYPARLFWEIDPPLVAEGLTCCYPRHQEASSLETLP